MIATLYLALCYLVGAAALAAVLWFLLGVEWYHTEEES